jgi:sugar-specific transcriptional regulator TrmB
MNELLKKLGWKDKEIHCYLSLLEFGEQAASVIAKKLKMPKATVLFVLHRLCERGFLSMRKKGTTEYFYADPKVLKKAYEQKMREQQSTLEQVFPLLEEFKNPLTSPPKTSFFEGVEACKNAYAQVLESTSDVMEFATHDDLVEKFGKKWMDDFIKKRIKNEIYLESICHDSPLDRALRPLDKEHNRATKFIPEKTGNMYSCIVMYEDKLLMMNLSNDAFGILIENSAIVETMKTIHRIAWSSRKLT